MMFCEGIFADKKSSEPDTGSSKYDDEPTFSNPRVKRFDRFVY
jgi:hypothetical protein